MKIYFNFIFNRVIFLILVTFGCVQLDAQNIQNVGIPIDFNNGNEFEPAFSNDGKQIAFISDKSGKSRLYICKRGEENVWSEPEDIIEINDFKAASNVRYPSFNYDAGILFFSADFNKDSTDFDIYFSRFVSGKWTSPISLGPPVNSNLYDGQPSISADDKSLYFVRKKPDNPNNIENCSKILVSRKNINGEWTQPEDLPIPINVECEQNPRIGIDNKTLYFSSMREGGKGGYDNYKTKLLAKNVWIPAESLDTINTINNDYSPVFYFNDTIPYFQIEISEKSKLNSKIYKSKIPSQFLPGKNICLVGKVIELSTQSPIEAELIVFDPVTSRLISKYSNNGETGEFQLYLPEGSNYLIDISKNSFSHTFINIEALNLKANQNIRKDIVLYDKINLILNVFDEEIFKPINAEFEILNSKKVIVNPDIEKIKDGRYQISIPIGDEYDFTLKAGYFEPLNFMFDLRGIVQFDEFEKDAELKSQKVDFQIDISDEETQTGIPVEVVITNLENNEVIRTTATANSEGKYIIKLRDGDSYNVSVSPKGYSYYNTKLDLKKKDAPKKLEVKLKQLKEDTKLTLNNITFEVNSSELKESSFLELDRVVKMMKDNPNIIIEISAHTDNLGSDFYNMRLSKRRASSVLNYMLEKKIPADRMISQGYGKTRPLFPNDTDENKALNRRVELKILKIQ